jgi:signal transduction histidine kinase
MTTEAMPPRLAQRQRSLADVWLRRILGIGLGLIYLGIVAGSAYFYFASPDWHITLDQNPYNGCMVGNCGYIAHVASGDLGLTKFPSTTIILCGYQSTEHAPYTNFTYIKPTESAVNRATTLVYSTNFSSMTPCGVSPADIETERSYYGLHIATNATQTLLATALDLIIATLSAALAIIVFLHGTRRGLVRLMTLYLTSLVLAFGLLPDGANNAFPSVIEAIVSNCIVPVLTALLLWQLLLRSSVNLPRLRRETIIIRIWVIFVGVGIATFVVAAIMANPTLYQTAIVMTEVPIVLTGVLASIVIVVWAGIRQRDIVRRDNARALMAGLIVAVTPFITLTLIPTLIDSTIVPVDGATTAVALGIFPATLAYVVLRRDLLRSDFLARLTTAQGMRALVLAIISGLIAITVSAVFGITDSTTLVIIFAALMLLGLCAPLVDRLIQGITENGLFPELGRYNRLLKTASTRTSPGSREQIAAELFSEMRLAMPISSAAVMAMLEEEMRFVSVGPDNAAPLSITDRLVRQLEARREPLLRREMSQGSVANVDPWECVIPVSLGERLVAMILLGPREDGLGYSTADRDVLFRLAARRAVALDYIRLLDEVRGALEEQIRVDQLKDQFIMTAHHELRTPLTGLVGYMDVAMQLVAQPEIQRQQVEELAGVLNSALRASIDLTHLLETLLQADRLSLQRPEVHPEQLELAPIMRRDAIDIEASELELQHRIVVSCPEDLSVWADRQALSQIIMNLLTNAMKYSPSNQPIEFTAARQGGMVRLSVRDHGDGVPPDKQHAIFERFIRLEQHLNSPIRGTGLGLAIARERVEAMGGDIWVESTGEPGEGSLFCFTVPIKEPSDEDVTLPAFVPPPLPARTPHSGIASNVRIAPNGSVIAESAPVGDAIQIPVSHPAPTAMDPSPFDQSFADTETLPRHRIVRYGPPTEEGNG